MCNKILKNITKKKHKKVPKQKFKQKKNKSRAIKKITENTTKNKFHIVNKQVSHWNQISGKGKKQKDLSEARDFQSHKPTYRAYSHALILYIDS